MLRAIFVASKWGFSEMLAHWLSQRTDLVGVVWIDSTTWQNTWKGRLQFARNRVRRYGLVKALDEILFYLYFHAFRNDSSERELHLKVVSPYYARHGACVWKGDAISVLDINSSEGCTFLIQRKPDVVITMCVTNYFGRKVRAIPKHGVFVWHEGITPEYKGLYSPFWAVHNLDFDRLGYTLLRMNDSYDAGEVFVQGRVRDVNPVLHDHAYIGHKAIADSLPAVEEFLIELEAGKAEPVERLGNQPHYYTYPGVSDLIRQRLRLKRGR